LGTVKQNTTSTGSTYSRYTGDNIGVDQCEHPLQQR